MDEKLQAAMDNFLQQRMTDCAMRDNESLQNAYQHFEDCLSNLKKSLSPEQAAALVALENAFSLVDGETQNCYYRAGFSDAVVFLFGWREGTWN